MHLMLDGDEVAVNSPPCGLSVMSAWYHLTEVMNLIHKIPFSMFLEATVVFKVHVFGQKLPNCSDVDIVIYPKESIREC